MRNRLARLVGLCSLAAILGATALSWAPQRATATANYNPPANSSRLQTVGFRSLGYSQGLSDASQSSGTLRSRHVAASSGSYLRLAYGAWYCDGSHTEQAAPNAVVVKASVENTTTDSGTRIPVTFAGLRSVAIPVNCTVWSDPVFVDYAANDVLYVNTFVDVSGQGAGAKWPLNLLWNSASPQAWIDSSGLEAFAAGSDYTDSGTFTLSGSGTGYGPCAIVGDAVGTRSVLLAGDSVMDGGGDLTYRRSFAVRACAGASPPIAYQLVSRSSDTAAQFAAAATRYRRSQICGNAFSAIVHYGTNDITLSGHNAAQVEASLLRDAAILHRMLEGGKVYLCTLLPRVTSTDGVTTVSGQTPLATESIRTAVNDWLRDTSSSGAVAQSAGTVAGVFDTASKVEVNSSGVLTLNGGRWSVGATLATGTATGGSSTTLVDSSQSWTTNQWTNNAVRITSGTGNGQGALVNSNTGTTLTINTGYSSSFSPAPANGSTYAIIESHSVDGIHPTPAGSDLMKTAIDTTLLVR